MNPDNFFNDAEAETILKNRAQELAQKTSDKDNGFEELSVVEFQIAHEVYALELNRVRIVHPLKDLTFIPGTPGFIRGVINLRGEIISVVDLRVFFDLPDQGITDLSQVIIIASEEMEFGVLADEILGTSSIPASAIQTSLPTLTGIREEYLKGVTGDRVVVLDGEKILSDEKMVLQ